MNTVISSARVVTTESTRSKPVEGRTMKSLFGGLLSRHEVARANNLSVRSVERDVSKGKLKALRYSDDRAVRFDPADVCAWAAAREALQK